MERALYWVERVGNRLPDPAALFVVALVAVWIASLLLAGHEFTVPAKDGARTLVVQNQLSGSSLAAFLASMVTVFTGFAPLGVVLVALLGVGVAEHTGFIRASLKGLVALTPRSLLSPMLLLVAIISHTAADVGYVLVIPLGGVIFHAAGRHPLAGIACAFAGVSGGFGANFIPSAIDPLLQGFTQSAAQILDSGREVNPLCNWLFTSVSSALVIVVGWILTDRVIEPRLKGTPLDGEGSDSVEEQALSRKERAGVWAGLAAMALGVLALFLAVLPADSPLRAPNGQLSSFAAPLMQSMIPLIFLLFLIPGTIYGYVAGTVKSHRDIITGMSKSMSTMGYYLTMIFFCAQFTAAFAKVQPGRAACSGGCGIPQGPGPARHADDWRHHRAERVRKPARRVSVRQVGPAGTGVRSGPDAGRALPRTHPGRLPRGRLDYKYRHAPDAVFSARGGLLPTVGEEHGNRHGHLPDAALFDHPADYVVFGSGAVLGAGHPTRAAVHVHVPVIAAGSINRSLVLGRLPSRPRQLPSPLVPELAGYASGQAASSAPAGDRSGAT